MMCQRWRHGRDNYRPAGEPINTKLYGVELLEGDKLARSFVEQHHYSGSYPVARLRVGLYRTRGQLHGTDLVGVAVFSVPAQQRAIPVRCGVPAAQGVELGRLVLLDEVPANGETWFLARARRLLRQALPQVRAILSYSDPVPRRRADGSLLKPGHVGTIYQASNALYLGRAASRTLYLDHQGRAISGRALSKIRNLERGHQYAQRQLQAAGAPPRLAGESAASWVKRSLNHLRKLRHPGNHIYVWRLDGGSAPASALPYPKTPDAVQGHLLEAA